MIGLKACSGSAWQYFPGGSGSRVQLGGVSLERKEKSHLIGFGGKIEQVGSRSQRT